MPIPNRPVSVVTGAGSGLGRALCMQLSKRGGRIIAADIHEEAARETVRLLGSTDAVAVRCDVSKRDEVVALAALAEERFGAVDFVANNAGVAVSGDIGEIPPTDWDWIVGINLWGVIYGCEAFVGPMKRRGRGHILNIASLAGIANAARMGPYNVTKAGVIALSETMHGELRGTGVGVSVLCPSFFPTNIIKASKGTESKEAAFAERLMARSPWSADDIARIALEGCDRKQLHVLPHSEGRWFWRMRRLLPQRSLDLAVQLRDRVQRK
jgi:NAD(P)-dependent dehydrogenase (short-subunit alcohol dehydrogenase family)